MTIALPFGHDAAVAYYQRQQQCAGCAAFQQRGQIQAMGRGDAIAQQVDKRQLFIQSPAEKGFLRRQLQRVAPDAKADETLLIAARHALQKDIAKAGHKQQGRHPNPYQRHRHEMAPTHRRS